MPQSAPEWCPSTPLDVPDGYGNGGCLDSSSGGNLGASMGAEIARTGLQNGNFGHSDNLLNLNDNPPACFNREQHLEN